MQSEDVTLRTATGEARGGAALPTNPSTCAAMAVPGAVRRALAYLHRHHAGVVRLDDLARVARLSKYHFVRVFRRATGLAPHAYLTRLRVAHAMALLAGGAAISDAAYTAGFSAQSHLHRHFVRLVGITPGRYAARTRGGAAARTPGGRGADLGADTARALSSPPPAALVAPLGGTPQTPLGRAEGPDARGG